MQGRGGESIVALLKVREWGGMSPCWHVLRHEEKEEGGYESMLTLLKYGRGGVWIHKITILKV